MEAPNNESPRSDLIERRAPVLYIVGCASRGCIFRCGLRSLSDFDTARRIAQTSRSGVCRLARVRVLAWVLAHVRTRTDAGLRAGSNVGLSLARRRCRRADATTFFVEAVGEGPALSRQRGPAEVSRGKELLLAPWRRRPRTVRSRSRYAASPVSVATRSIILSGCHGSMPASEWFEIEKTPSVASAGLG